MNHRGHQDSVSALTFPNTASVAHVMKVLEQEGKA